jgi:hypothetical protein
MANDSLISGYLSLSRDVNKTKTGYQDEQSEGAIGELTPELELSMDDDELLELAKEWKSAWQPYQTELAKSQNDNETYWLGTQYAGTSKASEGHALVDNLIFESLETFLPIATRPKADPVVNSAEQPLADKVRKMLTYWADQQVFNLKLKQVVRFWSLYKLGVMKMGWSNKENDITCVSIRPQKLILDPDATIDCAEYTGEYIGEYRKETARNLIRRFPKAKKYITDQCKSKFGTKMMYIEWWTDDYVFWTMDEQVLAKAKNPHWNYESKQQTTDEMGQTQEQEVKGKNHFNFPKKPYAMLSVFSLGLRPYDDTNLIQQNLPLQDLINKRLRQIDKNADKTNGGLAVSGDSFSKEQAAGVGKATEKGGTIFVPNGDVNRAVMRLQAPPLPNFVYESLLDYRNELRNIFGVRGSTAQGTIQDKTVRGKQQIKGQDSDRIGGGISTYLEQFADYVYNYVVQMMYVYYDEEHTGELIGQSSAVEYVKLKNADFVSKLSVSVKDGSMIPKDPVSQREEVINLWDMGAVDPITFFEKLDFPDPKKSAEQLTAWKIDPLLLFPELKQQIGQPAPDPALQAQAEKIKQQTQMEGMKGQADIASKQSQAQLDAQKGNADLTLQDQKAQIEIQKGIQELKFNEQKHAIEMEKQKQALKLQEEKGRASLEAQKKKSNDETNGNASK